VNKVEKHRVAGRLSVLKTTAPANVTANAAPVKQTP
jgi:hypothetical protein